MAVKKADDRESIVLTWDPEAVGGPDVLVKLETSNLEDLSETSGRDDLKNDGYCTVTVPMGAVGSFHAVISGPLGSEEGDIDYDFSGLSDE